MALKFQGIGDASASTSCSRFLFAGFPFVVDAVLQRFILALLFY
jgi:hypothetical protein